MAHTPAIELAEFTGERFIPGHAEDEISLEHHHRYLITQAICEGKTVLDIACGDGYGSSILAKVAADVHGVDIDEASIESAELRYPTVNFRVGDAAKLPFSDGQFDVAVSFETLEHVPDPQAMLDE